MGYYTNICMNLKVKPAKLRNFKGKLKELKGLVQNDREHWFVWHEDLAIDENGELMFEDYYRKWNEEDKLYELLKGYVAEGYISGQGEEYGDIWEIRFDGKGNYYAYTPIFVRNDIAGKIEDMVRQIESENTPDTKASG